MILIVCEASGDGVNPSDRVVKVSMSKYHPSDLSHINMMSGLEKDPLQPVCSFSEASKVSDSTIFNHLHNSRRMKTFHFGCITHELTQSLPEFRLTKCGELLPESRDNRQALVHT
jgi:hypothetical protein